MQGACENQKLLEILAHFQPKTVQYLGQTAVQVLDLESSAVSPRETASSLKIRLTK